MCKRQRWRLGPRRLRCRARRENRQAVSADGAVRHPRSAHARRQHSSSDQRRTAETIPLRFVRHALHCWPSYRVRGNKGVQIQRLFRLVSLAHALSQQASRTRSQSPRAGRLDDRIVLPARHRANDRPPSAAQKINRMRSRASFLLIGVIVGALGTAALFFLGLAPGIGVVFGGIFGGCFALLRRFRAITPGAGLLGGLFFWFLFGPAGPVGILPKFMSNTSMGMLDMARAHFAELVGYLLLFGAPLGLVLGAFSTKKPAAHPNARPFSLSRALVAGGLAGIVGV